VNRCATQKPGQNRVFSRSLLDACPSPGAFLCFEVGMHRAKKNV
jgi:hypothetical protein